MLKHLNGLQYFLGLLFKLAIPPLTIILVQDLFPFPNISSSTLTLSYFIIFSGFFGLMVSDLLLLRFGDRHAHFSTSPTRLVDVSFYARNRHPFLWFYWIYLFGIMIHFYGFTSLTFFTWLGSALIAFLYILSIHERRLVKSLGKQYSQYIDTTPFITWKMKIPENQQIKLLPQLIWLSGMLFFRYWFGLKHRGSEHIPHDKPFIIVANHESYLDPFLFALFTPFEIKFVTTADVFTSPLMRFLLQGIGTFPMRRHRQDLKSIRTMIRKINLGQVVGIFPEGGRSIDGSPLPILKETLKLIQHCKVPILPVHLDGAYEIWPRWAPNRRRGKVSVTFKPVIPVKNQGDLLELEALIRNAIFASSKTFRSVKTHNITRGLDNFLWACNECYTHDSITVVSKNMIKCNACGSVWKVGDNYLFSQVKSEKSFTLIEWISSINSSMLNHAAENDSQLSTNTDEHIYLISMVDEYVEEKGVELSQDLRLALTDQRIILYRQSEIIDSWDMSNITIFTMDYHNAISIGVGGIRHTFSLQSKEIPLKWQTYFDRVKEKFSNTLQED
ncbi:1-acyl-sn-glycerol-3-phosphate acyltransferase [bacterium]|nr:1-acyl-sn-glycerol-3-phosphate acyltransferase [bacterium]